MKVAAAVVLVCLAFALYTFGAWSQLRVRRLHRRHLVAFWLGFAADLAGTVLMFQLSGENSTLGLHGVSGLAALALMLGHNGAATTILATRRDAAAGRFYRVSMAAWALWLIPFVTGFVLAAGRRAG